MLSRPKSHGPRERSKWSAGTDVAARYGFRRVEHVHIQVRNGSTIAVATGVAHRYPRSVRVPLGVASQLVATGVPHTIERIDRGRSK